MAMQRRLRVEMGDVFPAGAFLVGEVAPVADFDRGKRADGSRPQLVDRDTGLLVWSVQVLDADPGARKNEKTVTVKVLAAVQPVPPKNETPFPFTPVGFEHLEAVPYVDTNGAKPRLAWSFRASGFAVKAPVPQQVKAAS